MNERLTNSEVSEVSEVNEVSTHGSLPPPIDERRELIETSDGLLLEARVSGPPPEARGRGVICHPHPVHGGTMDNKVVTTCTRTCAAAGLATVRFDFRGVRESEGEYDDGGGERIDVRAALRHADRQTEVGLRVLCGFSFGAAMSAAVATEGERVDLLVMVGPPLDSFGVPCVPTAPRHGLLVIVGDRDQFCSEASARRYVEGVGERAELALVEGAGHFFHGRLDVLSGHVAAVLARALQR